MDGGRGAGDSDTRGSEGELSKRKNQPLCPSDFYRMANVESRATPSQSFNGY